MPNYEEVIQRAGNLRAMTGLTQQEFTALLPHVEHAFWSIWQTAPLMDNPARAGATVRMRPLLYPPWPTSCSSS